MITRDDYFMGRDVDYAGELTDALEANAEETIGKVNRLLAMMVDDGALPAAHTHVNSGWRPKTINANTPGAAKKSNHITCQAVDLADVDGVIRYWCMQHLDVLETLGLWMEHPAATKGWCHLQTVPPRSGHRVFYP